MGCGTNGFCGEILIVSSKEIVPPRRIFSVLTYLMSAKNRVDSVISKLISALKTHCSRSGISVSLTAPNCGEPSLPIASKLIAPSTMPGLNGRTLPSASTTAQPPT